MVGGMMRGSTTRTRRARVHDRTPSHPSPPAVYKVPDLPSAISVTASVARALEVPRSPRSAAYLSTRFPRRSSETQSLTRGIYCSRPAPICVVRFAF